MKEANSDLSIIPIEFNLEFNAKGRLGASLALATVVINWGPGILGCHLGGQRVSSRALTSTRARAETTIMPLEGQHGVWLSEPRQN